MKKIAVLLCSLLFCGCLSKSVKSPNVYELNVNSCGKNALKSDIVISTAALQTRSIFIKENNELKPLKGARFISFGEDMVERAVIKYFACNEPGKDAPWISLSLLELYASADEAVVTTQVEINKKQRLITARTHTGSLDASVVIAAMNESLEKVLAQIDNFASEVKLEATSQSPENSKSSKKSIKKRFNAKL